MTTQEQEQAYRLALAIVALIEAQLTMYIPGPAQRRAAVPTRIYRNRAGETLLTLEDVLAAMAAGELAEGEGG